MRRNRSASPILVLSLAALALAAEGRTTSAQAPKPEVLEHEPLFDLGNPLLEPIPDGAEIDPDSGVYVARMIEAVGRGGFRMGLNLFSYPIYYADAGTPRYDVTLTALKANPTDPAWGYCSKWKLRDVPIPDFAEADSSSDGRLMIVDRDSQCVYEFWRYGLPTWLSSHPRRAGWGSAIPIRSDGVYPRGAISAGTASNIAGPNGLIWPDEMLAGEIGHALVFGYEAMSISSAGSVLPATKTDGSSGAPEALPEGAHVQLDPDLDLALLGLDPATETIARALQDYGMYLVDGSAGVRLGAVSGLSADPNPWIEVFGDPVPESIDLGAIPVAAFRVLKLSPIVPDAAPVCPDNPCATYETRPPPCTGCCSSVAGATGIRTAAGLVPVALASVLVGLLCRRRRSCGGSGGATSSDGM